MAQLAVKPSIEQIRAVTMARTASYRTKGTTICGKIVKRDGNVVLLEFKKRKRAHVFVVDLLPDGFNQEVTELLSYTEEIENVTADQLVIMNGSPYRIICDGEQSLVVAPLLEGKMPEPASPKDVTRLQERR